MKSDTIRSGVSMVELLAVVSAICLLLAVFLPAMQGAREAERRMLCQTNLRHIGLALHQHHNTYDRFPDGQRAGVQAANWRVQILPFLNHQELYEAIDINAIHKSSALSNYVIPAWRCPSQTLPDLQPGEWNAIAHQVPAYQGIMGAYPNPAGSLEGIYPSQSHGGWWSNHGLLAPNETFTFESARDGIQNIVIVAEQSGRVGDRDLRNGYFSPWGSVTLTQKIGKQSPGAECWGMGLTCVAYPINSRFVGPGANAPYLGNTILNSEHPGGINVLKADGMVGFVRQSIHFPTFQRLCSKADGLAASLD